MTVIHTILHRLSSHGVHRILPSSPEKPSKALHRAMLETIWFVPALFSLEGTRRNSATDVCKEATWISHQGCEMRDFGPSACFGPSENTFCLAPWAGCCNSTHTFMFQLAFSYSFCPEGYITLRPGIWVLFTSPEH